jgi:succinate dehydrogenase / fumarate reductase membrane anchor subunit
MAIESPEIKRPVHRKDSLPTDFPTRAGRQPPAGRGAEFWWWVFMRVSGVVLLFLVNFGFVAVRWQNPFWQTWDWLLLSLAMIHGINGLRAITLDYVHRPGVRAAMNGLFAIVGLVLFTLGTVVVFTFDACKWPGLSAALRASLHC